jgi:hypothetical protein
MLNLEVKTKWSREKAMEALKNYFGKGGLGLEITAETSECLTFEGGGGFVTANVCSRDNHTRIDFQTQEWDYQVRKFSSSLP